MRVELSYEERIINALMHLPRVKGEGIIAGDKRRFDAIRAILQPLYAVAARAEAAERLNGELVAAVRAWEDIDGWWDDSDTIRHCGFCMEEGEHVGGCPMVLLARIESASS